MRVREDDGFMTATSRSVQITFSFHCIVSLRAYTFVFMYTSVMCVAILKVYTPLH